MTKQEANAKRIAAAHSPEARAKRAETMKRKKMAKLAEAGDETPRMHSIPLHAIPDAEPPKKKKKYVRVLKTHHDAMTRERAAMEITRLVMWLADPRNT
jgi:hypothetical protein